MDKQKDTVDICNNILDVIDGFYSKIDDACGELCSIYFRDDENCVGCPLCDMDSWFSCKANDLLDKIQTVEQMAYDVVRKAHGDE